MDETFEYMESWTPPGGKGYSRYASAVLRRTQDRKHWTEGNYLWVTDDFGYLCYVGRIAVRKMRQTSEDNYIGEDGFGMQREYGETPNGNRIGGRWVLRGPGCVWLDIDYNRHDLMSRHGFVSA